MKNQALFSSKDKSKKLKCHLLQVLFGAFSRYLAEETKNTISSYSCSEILIHFFFIILFLKQTFTFWQCSK